MKKRLIFLLLALIFSRPVFSQTIPSPRQAFGFQMGADFHLVGWSQIVPYLKQVGQASNRVVVRELGKSTLGKPFLLVTLSSAENIQKLNYFQDIQKKLAEPYRLTEEEARSLAEKGKAVVLITLNIHSTEIASSQEAVELVYKLATTNDPALLRILDKTILLLVPSLNPDGQQMVVDWYRKTVHTPYEGSPLPFLYHPYAGHDDNRDWFMFNLTESRLVVGVLYHDWFPEVVYDQHQMGRRSIRFFLPPYSNPLNPNVDPLITATTNAIGKYAVARLQEEGLKGVATGTVFNGYFEGTMSKTPFWHNRIGILSEAADTRLASPLYFPRSSLRGMGQDLPDYKRQVNFLDPWPGGWWHLRDIIDYEEAATFAILDFVATYKNKILLNFYRVNRKNILLGKQKPPFAVVIPANQRDPNAVVEMLKRLQLGHVRVYRSKQVLEAKGRIFPAGSFVIPLSQPERPYILDLLDKQVYPDLRLYPGGPPRPPYDITAWTLPLQMGVEAFWVNRPLKIELAEVKTPSIEISVPPTSAGWVALERRWLNAYKVVNALLAEKKPVYFSPKPLNAGGQRVAAGAFYSPNSGDTLLTHLLKANQVQAIFVEGNLKERLRPLRLGRIGIYQSYLASMDEGWTRWVLDHFGFPYRILHDADFRKNRLKDLDVLIFPSLSSSGIANGLRNRNQRLGSAQIMKQYTGGLGTKGIRNLRAFLRNGGTALFFSKATNFAIEQLGVPARNAMKGVATSKFYAPGTLLKLRLRKDSPLCFGMPAEPAVFFRNDPIFSLLSAPFEMKEVGVFPESGLLLSGWLRGEARLHGKVALADIPYEKGRVILYGFRVQHRSQTFGTFKLFFNALYE